MGFVKNIFLKISKKRRKKSFLKLLNANNIVHILENTTFDNCIIKHSNNNRISIGKNCTFVNCKFTFYSDNCELIIGDDNSFFNTEFWLSEEGIIVIGNNNLFAGLCQIAAIENKKIEIGNECLFSSKINLRTGDSHPIFNEDGTRANCSSDIFIGNKVWVCQNCYLLKGSIINDGSVVGCCSVVNKTFLEKSVVIAGNPAKIVKHNITWNKDIKNE